MNSEEFIYFRKGLEKTQKEIAELLGTSLKAIHSYEQGWRKVPVHAERQILFLFSKKKESAKRLGPCWEIIKCPSERKEGCPAWEFRTGELCWFINGTFCDGTRKKDWREKMKICRKCEVFAPLLPTKVKKG